MKALSAIIGLVLSQLIFANGIERQAYQLPRKDMSKIDFYLAKGPDSSPNLLLLLQGSDCNSVFYNDMINYTFSQVLVDKDVLTIEKYGITPSLSWNLDAQRQDCPESYIQHDSPSQRVKDIKQVLSHVLGQGTYHKVIILGGSEGALIANLVSAEMTEISQTIAINGGGRWFIDDVLYNIQQTVKAEEVQEQQQGFMGFSQHILTSPKFDINMSGHGYTWWREMFELDQSKVISDINNPVLMIQTQADINVSPSKAASLALSLMAIKENVFYQTYDNLDHGFKRKNGTRETQAVVDGIKTWLKAE